MFTDSEIQQIKEKGIDENAVLKQIENFKNGFPFLNVYKAATIDSGIKSLISDELNHYIEKYESVKNDLDIIKFVPASGAATRMFKALLSFMETYTGSEEEYLQLISDRCFTSNYYLYERMDSFAFFEDLKQVIEKLEGDYDEIIRQKDYNAILKALLTDQGLDYGNLPKGLLKFHKYDEYSRTPVEEHIIEGSEYALSKETVQIHFTVSPNHKKLFQDHIKNIKSVYEKHLSIKLDISFSVQDPKTDIIAVTTRNNPAKDKQNNLVFRPGGHGAILNNLNQIDKDLIFIKNIDNVVPDRLREDTITYKKVLAGILLEFKEKIFGFTNYLENEPKPPSKKLKEIGKFLEKELFVSPPRSMYRYSRSDKIKYYLNKLDRPIRVCGMVKNEGEPGGGPFWVKNKDGSVSLQIVEGSQFDKKKKKQMRIFNNATHFNPVDLVCSVKNIKGEKYDLLKHRDDKTGFITKKSKDGVEIKAQELPGLWNGSMANWNTLFVEVPISTFNPVKIVNDLLRNEHMAIESVIPEPFKDV